MLFQIGALGILAAFYGCYFYKMLRQRGRGIHTNQLGKGKAGAAKRIELGVKLATVLAVAAEMACILIPVSRFPAGVRAAGFALGAVGVAAFALSVRDMGDSWRAGAPKKGETKLVTGGIYRYSRNPAFLGFDLVYIGILLMFFHPVLLALSGLAAMMLHLQIINVEEDFLTAAFGEDYREYRGRVNRYLGRRRL